MNNHEHGETDHELLSLRHVFVALFELRHRIKGLPDVFENIKLVNVYQAPGDDDGDDWESHLKDQEQAWIITFRHYLKDGSKVNRKASGGGRWHGRNYQHKTHGKTSWHERKFNLVDRRNEQKIANKYTMFEYLPDEDKPKYALCRITIDKRNNAHDRPLSSSQQREGKEIDHGNKGHKGGNFENATGYNNQQFLERQLRGLRKHYSDADIEEVLNRIKSEKLPAVSPKKHSTEAPVSNIIKRPRCTYTNTMAGGTSTQRQELAKVEMVEQNAVVWEPNQLSPNFIVSSTAPMDNQNRIAPALDPSTSIFTTTGGRLDHQVQVQAPDPNTSNHSTIVLENIDSNDIFEGLTDLNTEDLHANRSLTRSHENGPIWEWDNLFMDESKPNCWDW